MSTRNRLLITSLILLVSLMLLSSSPMEKKEEVRIKPGLSEVTIYPNQVGFLMARYVNCSYGITLDWIAATDQRYELFKDGELIQVLDDDDAKWSEPYAEGTWPACIHGDGTAWYSDWRVDNLKITKPGVYQLESTFIVNLPLTDGADYDGDGFVDFWNGGAIYDRFVTTIYVLE